MRDRSDWHQIPTTEPLKVGRKTYKNLVRFTRACATCGEPFHIHVTRKIADGVADSNSFGLRNCEKHRRTTVDPGTIMANGVMKAELDGCYATIKQLQARLALYELPAAMAMQQNKMPWE